MHGRSISRRHLLRGAGGVALALPFLEIMPPRTARAAGAPKRLFVLYTAGGPVPPGWKLAGGETNYELPEGLAPLSAHRKDVAIVYGLDNKACSNSQTLSGVGAHQASAMTTLTGAKLLAGGAVRHSNQTDKYYDVGGESIDQVIARQIGNARSLQLGAQPGEIQGLSTVVDYLSASGARRVLPNEVDPNRLFARIFANVKPTTPSSSPAPAMELMRLRAQRASVLDTVKGDYQALLARLGAEDRMRVQSHLEALRNVEKSLDATSAEVPKGCVPPSAPQFADMPARVKTMFDLATMALTCDRARVITMMGTPAGSHLTYSWLNHTRNHHDLGHSESRPEARKALIEIENWWCGHLARLVATLKATPEGEATAFDNSVILWAHELRAGGQHATYKSSFLLIGNGGGALRTGRYFDFEAAGRTHNDLLVSLLNAFGVPATTFGDASLCKGPLPGLLAV